MESVLRALLIYFFLLLVTRLSGRRTLGEMTIFDFVLILVIGEATQQALLGDDFSIINAWIVIATLIIADIVLAFFKGRSKRFEKWIDGKPSVLVEDGKIRRKVMDRARVDEDDILEAARKSHGLGRFAQIKHAILEKDGNISIIPR